MKKTLTLLAFFSLSTAAFSMFCPNNFNQINMGDTIEQVQLQCGKPDGIKTSKGDDKGPQEWNMYVHPQMKKYTQIRTNSGAEASLKMSLAFNNDKLVNITVNGMSLASTTVCGAPVSIGDSTKSVKAACGDPVFVNKSSESNGQKPTEIIEFKYNSTPPTTLVFENGKLQARQ